MRSRSLLASLASTAMPGVDLDSVSRLASKVTVSVTVNLGADSGQPLGTLFQLRRASSTEVVAALGVPQFYNHYVRSNPRMLHAHGRRSEQADFSVQALGSSHGSNPRYHVFVLDDVLIDGTNREYFDEVTEEWVALPNPWNGATFAAGEQINFAHRIGSAVFISTDKGLFYDGVRIITSGAGSYKTSSGAALYHDGLLFTNWDTNVISVYSWTPGGAVGSAIGTYSMISGHFVRAFGVLAGTVYAMSSRGTFLRYNTGANTWMVIGLPENIEEFYCLMQVFDEIRIGDYPNGDQWRFSPPSTLTHLVGSPPEEAGAGSQLREIQAMTFYGGELVCPLFPWGVVHRQHMSTGNWYYQRLYTAPAIDTSDGPYVAAFSNGDWRQRIPCAGLWRESVILAGANKAGDLTVANAGSVTNLEEYGTVWKLTRPHAVSAELDWAAGETTFSLEISAAGGIVMKQDGVTLASVAGFAPSQFEGDDAISVDFGNGLYGAFTGEIVGSSTSQEF